MIRLINAQYLDTDTMTVKHGDIAIDGDRISAVGELPAGEYERTININGNLVIPGFCNAHAHSPMTFLRSAAEDLPLDRWLNESVFPREDKLTFEQAQLFTKLSVLEYLANGITSCFDMYFFPCAESYVSMGFRAVFCSSFNQFWKDPEIMVQQYEKYNAYHPLISYKMGVHAEYTNSRESLEKVSEIVHRYKAPFWLHVSETEKEVRECVERHGITPPVLMDDLGLWDFGGGGYHCVWFADEDYEVFKRHGLYAVTNPCSNAKLASGICPVKRFRDEGIGLAIGTDGPASNNALSMFREMYMAAVLTKLKEQDPAAVPAEYFLKAATSGGAAAMGIDGGNIAAGKLADFTVIDLDRPAMRPHNNILDNLVYSGGTDCIKMTAVNGKILYENGEYNVNEDIEKLYFDIEQECKKF